MNFSDYKVGDKVRIVGHHIRPRRWNIDGHMDKWMGQIVTISDICYDSESFHIEEDSGWYFDYDDIAEYIPPITLEDNLFEI